MIACQLFKHQPSGLEQYRRNGFTVFEYKTVPSVSCSNEPRSSDRRRIRRKNVQLVQLTAGVQPLTSLMWIVGLADHSPSGRATELTCEASATIYLGGLWWARMVAITPPTHCSRNRQADLLSAVSTQTHRAIALLERVFSLQHPLFPSCRVPPTGGCSSAYCREPN